jgi:hypothetical protein
MNPFRRRARDAHGAGSGTPAARRERGTAAAGIATDPSTDRAASGESASGQRVSGEPATGPFTCSSCGRTGRPPAGEWDPPICEECDAEINFAAIEEVELTHD